MTGFDAEDLAGGDEGVIQESILPEVTREAEPLANRALGLCVRFEQMGELLPVTPMARLELEKASEVLDRRPDGLGVLGGIHALPLRAHDGLVGLIAVRRSTGMTMSPLMLISVDLAESIAETGGPRPAATAGDSASHKAGSFV